MITLEEAVIGIPIGEAAGIGIPFIAEDVDVLLVHLDRRVRRSMASVFFLNYNISWTTQRRMDVRGRRQSALFGPCSKLNEAGESEDTLVYRYREAIICASCIFQPGQVRSLYFTPWH